MSAELFRATLLGWLNSTKPLSMVRMRWPTLRTTRALMACDWPLGANRYVVIRSILLHIFTHRTVSRGFTIVYYSICLPRKALHDWNADQLQPEHQRQWIGIPLQWWPDFTHIQKQMTLLPDLIFASALIFCLFFDDCLQNYHRKIGKRFRTNFAIHNSYNDMSDQKTSQK